MNEVYEFERETTFRGRWAGVIYWQLDRETGRWRHRPGGYATYTKHKMLDVEWAADAASLVDGLPGQIMNAMRYW